MFNIFTNIQGFRVSIHAEYVSFTFIVILGFGSQNSATYQSQKDCAERRFVISSLRIFFHIVSYRAMLAGFVLVVVHVVYSTSTEFTIFSRSSVISIETISQSMAIRFVSTVDIKFNVISAQI